LTVVLLHSSGLSARQWHHTAAALRARGERVVVPDLLGHGEQPAWPEPRPLSFRDDVARIVDLLAAEEAPVALGGHSYGGFVALQAARAIPERIAALWLYDPVAFGALDPRRDGDALAELAAIDLRWERGAEGWLAGFVDYWGGTGAWAALREPVRAEFRRVGWAVQEGVRTLMTDATPAADYGAIAAPARLATGEHSPLAARRVVARLAEVLRAETAEIRGAGHMGPMTHAGLVTDFFLA
jgi:pimeloyl-ACP methyl ester carboxylesterase